MRTLAIMADLIDVWGDVLAWTVVLAAVVACAAVATRLRRPSRTVPPLVEAVPAAEVAIEGPRRLGAALEWSLLIRRATQDLARGAAVAALHADAARKIAAAEHAYNRLVDDCANLCPPATAPAVVPPLQRVAVPREFVRALARPLERQPLAA